MAKRITLDELLFCWSAINDLKACLNNQIEAGAEGVDEYSDDGVKAMEILSRERTRLMKLKKKKLKTT